MRIVSTLLAAALFTIAGFSQENSGGLDPGVRGLLRPESGFLLGVQWRKALSMLPADILKKQLAVSGLAASADAADAESVILEDIDAVYVAGSPARDVAAGRQTPVLAIVRGRFDRTRMQGLLRGHGEIYRRVLLMTPPGVSPPQTRVAMLDEGTILIGDRKEMMAALDRLAAPSAPQPAGKTRTTLLDRAEVLAKQNDLWLLIDAPPGGFQPPPPQARGSGASAAFVPSPEILSNLRGLDLGVSFSGGLRLQVGLRAKSAEAGKNLAAAVQGLLALAALSQQAKPEALDALRRIEIEPQASTVNVSLSLTEQEVRKVYAEMQASAKNASARRFGGPAVSGGNVAVSGADRPSPAGKTPRRGTIRILGQDTGTVEVPVGGQK
jgi:hypothetical protein